MQDIFEIMHFHAFVQLITFHLPHGLPWRCFLELQHARAAYRPGLGSFQWEAICPLARFDGRVGGFGI